MKVLALGLCLYLLGSARVVAAQDFAATVPIDDGLDEGGDYDFDDRAARWLSDSLLPISLTALSASPALGEGGEERAEEALDSLAYTGMAVTLLKYSTRVPRPNDPTNLGSFPSGHTAMAFALATALSDDEPELAYPLYAWATAVGWSREETGPHRWGEIAAGAAIGVGMTKLLDSKHRPSLARRLSSSHQLGDLDVRIGPQPAMGCLGLVSATW